jgi:hypothetical protein
VAEFVGFVLVRTTCESRIMVVPRCSLRLQGAASEAVGH